MRRPFAYLGGIAVVLGAAGAAPSVRPGSAASSQPSPAAPAAPSKGAARTLIDRRLQEHAVVVMALDGDTITYTEASGLVRKESRAEVVAILPQDRDAGSAATTALRPPSEIEFVDGQRFPGALGNPTAGDVPAETFAWEYPVLGTLDLKLDQVRTVRLRQSPTPEALRMPASSDSDVVLLTNGDRATGLLEGFLAAGPALRLSVSGQGRDVPLDRVQEVRLLTNPPAKPPADATILWLRDGAIASARALRTARTGEVSFEIAPGDAAASAKPPGSPPSSTLAASGNIALADILAVEFHPGALIPLASLTPAEQRPAPGRRWTKPVAVLAEGSLLHLSDLELPGPMAAEWDIPVGVTRFAAEAELPRSSWDWGDAELSVALIAGGHETELFRRRLTADQPRASINAPLATAAGARLRIRLDPGPYGPVQDRVVLHRPVLLVDAK